MQTITECMGKLGVQVSSINEITTLSEVVKQVEKQQIGEAIIFKDIAFIRVNDQKNPYTKFTSSRWIVLKQAEYGWDDFDALYNGIENEYLEEYINRIVKATPRQCLSLEY